MSPWHVASSSHMRLLGAGIPRCITVVNSGLCDKPTWVQDRLLYPHIKVMALHISLGHHIFCQHGAFSGVGAFVASFVPAGCPKGGGMWGIFGKPLKWAIWNTLGLHALLTTCLRFSSVLDGVSVGRCI